MKEIYDTSIESQEDFDTIVCSNCNKVFKIIADLDITHCTCPYCATHDLIQ